MNEDYGNIDQMTMFAFYCFNAGATVVPMRPVGYQTNEVVLDNVSPAVTWSGAWSDSTSTVYYGQAGAVPYRFASVSATETATATYTPTIPVAGFYPVYTWVLSQRQPDQPALPDQPHRRPIAGARAASHGGQRLGLSRHLLLQRRARMRPAARW